MKVIIVLSSLTARQIHSTIGNLEKGNFMNNGFVLKIVAAIVLRGTIYFLALITIEDREDRKQYALSLFTAVFVDSLLCFEKFTNENLPSHGNNSSREADFLSPVSTYEGTRAPHQ